MKQSIESLSIRLTPAGSLVQEARFVYLAGANKITTNACKRTATTAAAMLELDDEKHFLTESKRAVLKERAGKKYRGDK
jgi:hypothetical protein